MPDNPAPTDRRRLTTGGRDLHTLADDLAQWLGTRVGADRKPEISALSRPQAGGMSSSSILFDAQWTVAGVSDSGSFVVRMAPDADTFPVFETYDLELQYTVMAGVAASTEVPIPPLRWLETDEKALGVPFFVMDRVDGQVPGDNPPYVFAGWLHDASVAERTALTAATVDVLARIHAIAEPAQRFPMLDGPGPSLRRHLESHRRWYRWALADGGHEIPLIERAFDWLERNFPDDPGPDVLCWGDSRPGNIIYRDFTPVAVLDWEMAALGPCELDLAWMIFLHRFFQDIALRFELPGLPDFMRRSDVVAHYERASGHTVHNLDFHLVYAAVRQAIVMARMKLRMIGMGEDAEPDDPDDYVMHRACLEELLDGTYEWD